MRLSALMMTTLFAPFLFAAPADDIKASLAQISPTLKVDEITQTAIPGIYQIVAGPTVLYSDASGKYILEGPMYHFNAQKELVNITAERQAVHVKEVLSKVDPSTMIIFKAPQEKTFITVFTDIDCGYCRALHKEVGALNNAGISVRYMAFPRVAAGEPSFVKAQSVWCAPDRNEALTLAKQGKDPKPATCNDPVAAQQNVGKSLQLNVTPVIVFKNGTVMPGYMPSNELIPLALKES